MKKTGIKAAIIVVLAVTVLAGEAFAGPGRGGRGGRQGRGRGMGGGPRMDANLNSAQPDNSWVPGPYCPYCQRPYQNIRGRQGRGRGGFGQGFQGPRGPYCPVGQGPNQNIQGRQGRGPGSFNQGWQGRGPGEFGQGWQNRGPDGFGQGWQGRGGRGFQDRDIAPQGRGVNGRRGQPGPRGIGRQGPGMQPQRFTPEDTDQTNQPIPRRGRGWAPGAGAGWRRGWVPDLQPEKAPDTNAPAEPVVEDQPEKP